MTSAAEPEAAELPGFSQAAACTAAGQGAASAPVAEDDLEFKPAVKYTAAGLLVCAVLGLAYSLYWLGHRQGFRDGVSSELVAEHLNAAAAQNLNRFLQISAADDAELQAMAAEPDKAFAWIQDTRIRREAEWQLAQVLMARGMAESAEPLLQALFTEDDALWAQRAVETGDALLQSRRPVQAAAWYRRAADACAACGLNTAAQTALEKHFAALGCTPEGYSTETVEALMREAEARPDARTLRSALRLHLGSLLLQRGEGAKAAELYRMLTDELAPGGATAADLTAAEKIYLGSALAQQGHADDALPLLTEGEQTLSHTPADVLCRLEALRRSASALMQQRGDVSAALALLNRAEGVAEGSLPQDHAFRPCLAEQRAWLLLLSQDEDAALASFLYAAEAAQDAATAMQAMEGAGRCLLALNRAEEAETILTRCAGLRAKHSPQETGALGRVTLLLAQAQDHRGQTAAAAEHYKRAAEWLASAGESESANLLTALLGQGYALIQLKQWPEGMQVWERIQPLVKDIPDRREEARTHLNECRRHNHLPSAAVPHDPQATAQAAAADAAAEAEAEDEEDAEEAAAQ